MNKHLYVIMLTTLGFVCSSRKHAEPSSVRSAIHISPFMPTLLAQYTMHISYATVKTKAQIG